MAGTPFVVAPPGTSTFRLLEEGAGAALVPESVARTAAALGAVTARPSPHLERALVLIHRAGPLSPAASRFIEVAVGE